MSLTLRQNKLEPLTWSEMDNNLTYLEQLAQQGGGGGLGGTQYLLVQANGTDVENAQELQAAYDEAKTMSPSAINRITVIAAPGNYNFSSDFVMDEEYIDLVSLDGNRSIIFNGSGTISITENDVFVKGVDVQTKTFTIGENLNLLTIEKCKGLGVLSFGVTITSSTFIDCIGGDFSFGGAPGIVSGTFINCIGEFRSFGGSGAESSGVFINCKSGDQSFGNMISSGMFKDCEGGDSSFSPFTSSGTFTNCIGGTNSFGGSGFGTASGTFTNCQGGDFSFGGGGTLSGKLYYCRLTDGTFETVSGSGVIVLCIDGNNSVNNQN